MEYVRIDLLKRYWLSGVRVSNNENVACSLYTKLIESRGTFNNVPKDAWYANVIETADDMGLAAGTGQGKFEPNAEFTREQLAMLAHRLVKHKTGEAEELKADIERALML